MADKTRAVLIVDDHKTMRRIIRELLGRIGFKPDEIHDVASLREARELLNKKRFDVVLCDIDLGETGAGGIELLQEVRQLPNLEIRYTPFIMVTTDAHKQTVQAALKHGIHGYLLKPFREEALRAELHRVKSLNH
jgi:two-component system chemotaxis response regulator CheY